MGFEDDSDKIAEIHRLVRENNRMLHKMRRNAFFGSLFRAVMWGVLVIVPLWLYLQYVAPVMRGMMTAMDQMQGTRAGVEAQFSGFNETLQNLRAQFPQYFQGE